MLYYINDDDVKNNLGFKECIGELKEAFISEGSGESASEARNRINSNNMVFATMPAYYGKRKLAGLKTYIYGKNGFRFVVIAFNTDNPEQLFIIDANVLGQIRTGALSALVTSQFVKKESINYTLIGSGFQAETQLKAMSEIYKMKHAWVYSRNFSHAEKFASNFGFGVTPVNDLAVLKKSDVISSVTDTVKPIFNQEMLPEKYHINLVGSNVLTSREAAADVIDGSDIIIDENREQSYKESSEVSNLKDKSKLIGLKTLFENPEKYEANRSIFKCLGIGLEDLAAAYIVLKNMSLV
ncbi:MAG: ornithine cyclodeaminase [Ferroplasma sp.]